MARNHSGRSRTVMSDVAALAGVSSMTVSRVLNHPGKVSPETRAKVMMAVRELGYRPNPAARVLATGRSGVLGVVGVDSTLYGPRSTLYAIETAARANGFLVSIHSLGSVTSESVAESVDYLRQQIVDGVIVIAPLEGVDGGPRGVPDDFPLVDVGGGLRGAVPVSAIDQRAGAARATRHLLSLGHKTVWHIAGPPTWIDANERVAGWREALGAAGREAPEPLIGDWSAHSGYEHGRRLARDPSVTAVFAANDSMALGLLRALGEEGRKVPEDVSVIGFDDIPEAAYIWPPLTTVRQDFWEVGKQSFHLLLHRMGGRSTDSRRLVEPELVLRDSTAAPVR
ncbi:LacI family DNA-binding transcriptional regulator [Sphaerisporangium aureirubrum]|uniref:LacI family DNA-binding transcriptional regulator n=1 Tax=Sphaerisporangium aureirubrum TaxID=1544736 RepID=A0ABW1NXU1_9ACTN